MSESSDHGRRGTAIGNAVTRLHREHYGRGATTTRTVMQRNFVAVLPHDIYTPVERTLIDAGDQEIVKQTRQAFQVAMTGPFSAAVEEITGRKAIAFMSQVHFSPDMAVEAFLLEPTASENGAEVGG